MVKTKSKTQPNKRNLPCIKPRQFHFPAQTASISQMLHSYPSGRQAGTTVGVSSSTTATDLEETHLLPVTPNYNPAPHVLHVLNPLWRQLSFGALVFHCSPAINTFPQVVTLCSSYAISQLQPRHLLSTEEETRPG